MTYLRISVAMPALGYADLPSRIAGGFETDIYRFRLAGEPRELAGTLVLRQLRPVANPLQIRLEAAVQNGLAAQGYPAPRVRIVEVDPAHIGSAFLIMDFVEGAPLAKGLDAVVSGAGFTHTIRMMIGMPRLVHRMAGVWAAAQLRLHALPSSPLTQALTEAGLDAVGYTFDGRLAALGSAIDGLGLDYLKPVHAWLTANRPPQPAVTSVCHNDLHPLNILAVEGRITGVVDWGNIAIGDPALEIGSTIAALLTTPLDVPAPVRPVVRGLLHYALWSYRRAYEHVRPLDPEAVRYYRVFRNLSHLVGALRNAGRDGAPASAHALPGAQRLLLTQIRKLTGITVSTG